MNEEISKLKDAFRKEMDEFKVSMKKELDGKDARIKELTESNDALRASIVRQATTQPVEKPKEKTKEQIYADTVIALAERTIAKMKKKLKGE